MEHVSAEHPFLRNRRAPLPCPSSKHGTVTAASDPVTQYHQSWLLVVLQGIILIFLPSRKQSNCYSVTGELLWEVSQLPEPPGLHCILGYCVILLSVAADTGPEEFFLQGIPTGIILTMMAFGLAGAASSQVGPCSPPSLLSL